MEMEEEKEEGGDGRDEELEERGEDGESGYEDSVSEGVETLTDGTGVENDTLDTGFSEGGQSTLTLPTSDTLESLAVEDSVESLTDQLLLVSLQETLDGRISGLSSSGRSSLSSLAISTRLSSSMSNHVTDKRRLPQTPSSSSGSSRRPPSSSSSSSTLNSRRPPSSLLSSQRPASALSSRRSRIPVPVPRCCLPPPSRGSQSKQQQLDEKRSRIQLQGRRREGNCKRERGTQVELKKVEPRKVEAKLAQKGGRQKRELVKTGLKSKPPKERGALQLWQIQQTLGRGDFIEGVLRVSLFRDSPSSSILAPVSLARGTGHLSWRL